MEQAVDKAAQNFAARLFKALEMTKAPQASIINTESEAMRVIPTRIECSNTLAGAPAQNGGVPASF